VNGTVPQKIISILQENGPKMSGQKNDGNEPLVDLQNIFLPPVRFKLGMMNSVKPMVHDGKGFRYLQQKYLQINESPPPPKKNM
jgi:hypothetical protein